MPIHVRDATREDADGIADAHIASWRAAYGHIFPDSIFEAPDFDRSRRTRWRAWMHSEIPDRRLMVATIDDLVVGFALTGDSDDEASLNARDPSERFGQLFGFYLHPDAWGSGAAGFLMDASIEHLAQLGHDRAVVWTLGDAARARRFYKKSGWTETGRTDMWSHYPDHPVEEVELACKL